MIEPTVFNTLRQFRAGVYRRFGARRDALFELLDAVTVATGVDPRTVSALPAPSRPGEVYRSCLDVRRALTELPLATPVPLAEGLRRTVEWVRSR